MITPKFVIFMPVSFSEKQESIKDLFKSCATNAHKYEKIIELGKQLPSLEKNLCNEENRVPGCQSLMYLVSECRDGKVYFHADSDALISKGLAWLLIELYSGETPESILTTPPAFVDELGLISSLSLNRANGFASIHLKMKQCALNHIQEK